MRFSTNAFYLGLIGTVPLQLTLVTISPYAGLILPTLMSGCLVKKTLPKLRKKRNRIIAATAIVANCLLATPQAHAAVQFSFLLGATNQMVETCYQGPLVWLWYCVFWILRGIYLVPLGLEFNEAYRKYRHLQDFSGETRNIAIALMGAIFLGLIEPLFSRACY